MEQNWKAWEYVLDWRSSLEKLQQDVGGRVFTPWGTSWKGVRQAVEVYPGVRFEGEYHSSIEASLWKNDNKWDWLYGIFKKKSIKLELTAADHDAFPIFLISG